MSKEKEPLLTDGVNARDFDSLVLSSVIKSSCGEAAYFLAINRTTRDHNREMYTAIPNIAKSDKARAERKRK